MTPTTPGSLTAVSATLPMLPAACDPPTDVLCQSRVCELCAHPLLSLPPARTDGRVELLLCYPHMICVYVAGLSSQRRVERDRELQRATYRHPLAVPAVRPLDVVMARRPPPLYWVTCTPAEVATVLAAA